MPAGLTSWADGLPVVIVGDDETQGAGLAYWVDGLPVVAIGGEASGDPPGGGEPPGAAAILFRRISPGALARLRR